MVKTVVVLFVFFTMAVGCGKTPVYVQDEERLIFATDDAIKFWEKKIDKHVFDLRAADLPRGKNIMHNASPLISEAQVTLKQADKFLRRVQYR